MAMNDLAHYRGLLHISKHRLDDELEIQADHQERISAQVTRLNTRVLQAKEDLAKVEARLFLDFKDSDEKLTEAQVKAKILRHGERERAAKLLQECRQDHEEWSGLLDAWKGRGYNIKTLAELYGSQYFALRSVTPRTNRPPGESRSERAAREAEHSAREAGLEPRRQRRRVE